MSDADENQSPQETRGSRSSFAHQVHHDWEDSQPLSTTIVKVVSAVSGRQPTDFDPLYETIDTDALDKLFQPLEDGPRPPDSELYLTLAGHRVRIRSDGLVAITTRRVD